MTDTKPAPLPSSETATTDGGPAVRRTARDLIDEWCPRLCAIRDDWALRLPPEAESTWKRGGAYVRESSAQSLGRDAPDVQLVNTLDHLARKQVYVAADALFFDVQTATDIAGRAAFQRLFERAIAGDIQAIGVYINERLFRNLEQATRIKRAFRAKGIDLHYLGKFEGDARNPAAWQLETMQDTSAELHARNTSYYVGMAREHTSRQGKPPGHIPEVFKVGDRAPSFMGRQGSPISWLVDGPLATVLKEGCRRYLEGMSFEQLAAWSETTVLGGVTPKKHVMTAQWWRGNLKNPRLAGYQMPSTYMGFKPGKETPAPPRLTIDSELVPCGLPALWPLETYYAIRRKAQDRWRKPKVRRTYRQYLLAGIAYDERCGHKLRVKAHLDDGRFWMRCLEPIVGHRPTSWRVDTATAELDAVVGSIRFEEKSLLAHVEAELRQLSQREAAARSQFNPNPAIAAARKALASLDGVGFETVRDQLTRQIALLEHEDEERREVLAEPIVQFRRAMAHLENWSRVWAGADVAAKNELLREAGVRVWLDRLPNAGAHAPARIVRIDSDNPMFALALSTATPAAIGTLPGNTSVWDANVPIRLVLVDDASEIARSVGVTFVDDHALVVRPPVNDWADANGQPLGPMPGWTTVQEYRRVVGLPLHSVLVRIDRGLIESHKVWVGAQPTWVVRIPDDAQVIADSIMRRKGRTLAERLVEPGWMTTAQYASRMGVTTTAVKQRLAGGTLPGRKVKHLNRTFWLIRVPESALEEAA